MKKSIVTAALAALLSLPATAAVQYEFFQKSTSDGDVVPATDMTARALVEGSKSRIEVMSGNLYPPGSFIIAEDGARHMFFVDRQTKTYTEFNAMSAASALGASNIKIENLKSDVTQLDDHPVIAGQPTDHYRLALTYDITVVFRSMPLKQSVRTVIDKWTTLAFGNVGAGSLSSVRTGNIEIDKIVDLETARVPGLALRENVVTTTIDTSRPLPGSELKLPATRTVTREMWVTKIEQAKADATSFVVPASYQRANAPEVKPATQVLDMKPVSK